MKAVKTATIFLLCIIHSCAKESFYMPCNIFFKGSLEQSIKSSTYLSSGVKASIFIFNALTNCETNLTPDVYLFSDGFFGMYPSRLITVQSDLYNFFSVSYNNTSHPYLTFDNNYLAIPENNRDYIWASKQAVYIYNNSYVQLIYKHIATKTDITINIPESFTNVSINYIKFTLPDCSSSYINLKTGEILPASLVQPLSLLEGSGNNRSFLSIPCNAQKQIEISINATVESISTNNIIYKSFINEPFEAGIFYTVNVDIETLLNSSITLTRNEWSYNSNYIPY